MKYSTLFRLSGVYSLANWIGFVSNSIVAVTTDAGLVNILLVLLILDVNCLTIAFLTVFADDDVRHVFPLFSSYPTHTAYEYSGVYVTCHESPIISPLTVHPFW